MNNVYIILISITGVFILLSIVITLIQKRLVKKREEEYSKSIDLTEIRNQIKEKIKKENQEDTSDPVMIDILKEKG